MIKRHRLKSLKRRKRNRGSAVLEATILIPVCLGIFFLYIMFFLFLIEYGFIMQGMLEYMYHPETKFEIENPHGEISLVKQGNINIINAWNKNRYFSMYLEYKGNSNDPADKVRRWQIAADTIS